MCSQEVRRMEVIKIFVGNKIRIIDRKRIGYAGCYCVKSNQDVCQKICGYATDRLTMCLRCATINPSRTRHEPVIDRILAGSQRNLRHKYIKFTPSAKGYPARARTIVALVTSRGGFLLCRVQVTRAAQKIGSQAIAFVDLAIADYPK